MRNVLWGGFSEGHLHIDKIEDGFGGHHYRLSPAIFISKREARLQYEDVRRVEIREIKPKRRRKA